MNWSLLRLALRVGLTNAHYLIKPLRGMRAICNQRKASVLIAGVSGFVLSAMALNENAFCDAVQNDSSIDVSDEISLLRLKLSPASNYERVDSRLEDESHKAWLTDHVLHDTLKGPGKVEAYEVYHKKDTNEIVCIVKFGKSLNGYPKIVHGGITSLIFDNTYGWLFMTLRQPPAVTANLVINFRSPIRADTVALLRAKIVSIDGRKLNMTATLEDVQGKLLADSTTLFVTVKK